MLSTKFLCFITIQASLVLLTNAGLIFYNKENDTEAEVRRDFRDFILPFIRTYQETLSIAEDLSNLNSKPNTSEEQQDNNSSESSDEDKIEFAGVRILVLCTDADAGEENSTSNSNGTKCNVQQSKYSGWIDLNPDSKENDGNSTTNSTISSNVTAVGTTTTSTTPKIDLKDKIMSSNSTQNEISDTEEETYPI